MSTGLYAALSGANTKTRALEVASHNVANAATSGFKASRIVFRERLEERLGADQRYAAVENVAVDLTQGATVATGNPLDLALHGQGFFAVDTSNGERYTRNGSFTLDPEGTLVTSIGQQVLDVGGQSIQFPADARDIQVSSNGDIVADGDIVGTLKISQFNGSQLKQMGSNLYQSKGLPVTDREPPKILSGFLEKSNYNTVRGVVEIVTISRTYQVLLKMIESYKATEDRAATALGGPK